MIVSGSVGLKFESSDGESGVPSSPLCSLRRAGRKGDISVVVVVVVVVVMDIHPLPTLLTHLVFPVYIYIQWQSQFCKDARPKTKARCSNVKHHQKFQ